RSRRRSLTAMSASETGDLSCPLVQCLNPRDAVARARSPAARITSSSPLSSSLAGNGQPLDAQCRRVDAVAEFEIVGRRDRPEDVGERAGNGHFADRISALAVLDPEPRRAAAVI